MPGPEQKDRKHGRTPTTGTNTGEWRDFPEVPFEDAPAMPKPTGKTASGARKKAWHPMVEQWWLTTSTLPHAGIWRPEDWLRIHMLMEEWETYYTTPAADRKTAQLTEIRRQCDSLGIGEPARRALKIRYVPVEEEKPAARRGPVETKAAGKVVSLRDRRASMTGGGQAEPEADSATG